MRSLGEIFAIVFVGALFGLLILSGCFNGAVTGCCQAGRDVCASGQGVTQEYCEQELDGEFCGDKVCNTDSGKCE